MFSEKVILFGILDWGWGHAGRSCELIGRLSVNNKVIICAAATQHEFFRQRFPGHHLEELEAHHMLYSKSLPAWLAVLRQLPKVLFVLKKDRARAAALAEKYKADVIISDNRYGFRAGCRSILMTHQLRILAPFFSFIPNLFLQSAFQKFDEIWVPDHVKKKERLSGQLSEPYFSLKKPLRFIGPLSQIQKPGNTVKDIDILILLSGPEPQRSMLEAELCKLKYEGRVVLVRGSYDKKGNVTPDFEVINMASAEQLATLISRAKKIICRSGYSTLMDLDRVGMKDAILIPTPGQPEQEYLAEYWEGRFKVKRIKQSEIPARLEGVLIGSSTDGFAGALFLRQKK